MISSRRGNPGRSPRIFFPSQVMCPTARRETSVVAASSLRSFSSSPFSPIFTSSLAMGEDAPSVSNHSPDALAISRHSASRRAPAPPLSERGWERHQAQRNVSSPEPHLSVWMRLEQRRA